MGSLRSRVKMWLESYSIPIATGFLESGLCHFINEKHTEISIEIPPGDAVIYFFSPLLPLSGVSEAVMRKALFINAEQAETQGACIGIHAELNALAVFYSLNIDIDFSDHRLLNCFKNFIRISGEMNEKINKLPDRVSNDIHFNSGFAARKINWSR